MRVVLILCFVVALLAGLVISAPARLVYDALAPAGVQAGRVQGSVWRGQALRAPHNAAWQTSVWRSRRRRRSAGGGA